MCTMQHAHGSNGNTAAAPAVANGSTSASRGCKGYTMGISQSGSVVWDFTVPEKYANDRYLVVGQPANGACCVLTAWPSKQVCEEVAAQARTMVEYRKWRIAVAYNPLYHMRHVATHAPVARAVRKAAAR